MNKILKLNKGSLLTWREPWPWTDFPPTLLSAAKRWSMFQRSSLDSAKKKKKKLSEIFLPATHTGHLTNLGYGLIYCPWKPQTGHKTKHTHNWNTLWSPLLKIGMTILVCQSKSIAPDLHPTFKKHVNYTDPTFSSAFKISWPNFFQIDSKTPKISGSTIWKDAMPTRLRCQDRHRLPSGHLLQLPLWLRIWK